MNTFSLLLLFLLFEGRATCSLLADFFHFDFNSRKFHFYTFPLKGSRSLCASPVFRYQRAPRCEPERLLLVGLSGSKRFMWLFLLPFLVGPRSTRIKRSGFFRGQNVLHPGSGRRAEPRRRNVCPFRENAKRLLLKIESNIQVWLFLQFWKDSCSLRLRKYPEFILLFTISWSHV